VKTHGLKNGLHARPHPGPLPQERGNLTKAANVFELSDTVRTLALSPGERAGVRAGLPLTFPRVHHTLRANVRVSFELSSTVRKLALTPTLSPAERENTTPVGGGAVFGLISGLCARPQALVSIFQHREIHQVWAVTICVGGSLVGFNVLFVVQRRFGGAELRRLFFATPLAELEAKEAR
jgi:hypothetical protein